MADPNAQANLPAAQVNFALFPATAHGNVILDYTTREGREIFKSNTRGLFAGDYLFDLEPDGIYDFISAIKRRAVQADWVEALSVPVDNADPTGDSLLFMDHFGQFDLAHLRLFSTTFVASRGLLKTTFKSLLRSSSLSIEMLFVASLSTKMSSK